MTHDERSQVAVEREKAWQELVDSQLPAIWATAESWQLTPSQAEELTEIVVLRLLEWVTRQGGVAPRAEAVTVIAHAVSLAEAERMRRLSVWRASLPEPVGAPALVEASVADGRPC